MDILEKICHGFGLIISRRNSTWCLKCKTCWRKQKGLRQCWSQRVLSMGQSCSAGRVQTQFTTGLWKVVKDCRGRPVHALQLCLHSSNGPVSYKMKLNKSCAWFSSRLSIRHRFGSYHNLWNKAPISYA